MFHPESSIERLRQAHARLFARLDGLSDDAARRPSRLPDWSVGHVLAHLARNADSMTRRLEGAARDEIVDQYPGGPSQREAEIQAGAQHSAAELVADVRTSALAAERSAENLPSGAWERLSRAAEGQLRPASAVLISRIREVDVHHVDLGLGYTPADWPAEFVQETLADELPKLTDRVDPADLLAWLTGRGPAPTPSSWW